MIVVYEERLPLPLEGWAPATSLGGNVRRAHYMRDGRSVCPRQYPDRREPRRIPEPAPGSRCDICYRRKGER